MTRARIPGMMIRRLAVLAVLAVVAVLATPCAARAQAPGAAPAVYAPRALDPDSVRADLALLREALETVHPGTYRYTPQAEVDAALARLEARAARPMDEVELYREVSLLLALLRCDHTKAEYPAALAAHRRDRPTHLPFRFRLFDGRMYVASSDSAQAALPRGAEVVSIDGRPVAEILAALEPAVSFDGLTGHVTARKLEEDSDLMGSAFEHYYPVFFGLPGGEVRLEVRGPGAAPARSVTVRPIPFRAWTALPWPSTTYRAEFAKEVSFRMAAPRTALLRVGTFVNYREPADPMAVYGGVFARIAEAGADSLVVDLRDNGGGSDDAAVALARFLFDTAFVPYRPARLKAVRYGGLVAHVQSWGDRKELFEPPLERFTRLPDGTYEEVAAPAPVEPAPGRFRGPVTVLVGPGNASGSAMLVALLREGAGARLVGEPTGGSAEGPTAGRIFFLKLPHSGITVRVPVRRVRNNVRAFRPGYGVEPDVTVAPTLDDFLAGRDPVLEAALR